jgi:2-polyprenyl-3-methyl-5-hydroxy-6-metoxy-1,4-benzoquinol methylase
MSGKSKPCVIDDAHRGGRLAFVKGATDIYRCVDCGCIMADVEFQPDQYEAASYYTMRQRTKEDIDDEWGFRWRYILARISRMSRCASLLDVGAGNGYFVYLAASEFSIEASGLEISRQEVQFARETLGIDLLKVDLVEHDKRYDVVTCFNVIEHVGQPKRFFDALVERVEPGGSVVLTTPNPGCIQAKARGLRHWRMVAPPHHINLFTRDTLTSLFEQRGMKVLQYETLSTYAHAVRRWDTRHRVLRLAVFRMLKALGLGADHLVIARKPT